MYGRENITNKMRASNRKGTPLLSKGMPSWSLAFPLPIICILLLAVSCIARPPVYMPGGLVYPVNSVPGQSNAPVPYRLLNGKVASLGWIVGRDCQRGLQAYLQTASIVPDAALVGTGWIDPTTGKLINGSSNNCTPGSLSMDNVVQLVHNNGGMAYLTITMMVDGSPDSWTAQQQAAYIAKATTDPSYIDIIVQAVIHSGYDGVIMDLESADPDYPDIQQLFATYNQQLWAALKPLHKPYGIALIHKTSDHDEYYHLNSFQDWRLLAHVADFLVMMALDQSYPTPGPTVSIPWLKQILAYTLQTMPQMLPYIIWELPLYGATWHADGGKWIYDGSVSYHDAQTLVSQIPSSRIDTNASNLNDETAAHLVYTDAAGVKHALWYHTAHNLSTIVTNLHQIVAQVPRYGTNHLQIAVWYRTTSEPQDVWNLLDTLLPNNRS
ncbi:MAG TPA: hypothetical protein VFB12_14170 [Ktedonobacteraceae bacterium]|nr:hypothetical protein [Ktedonobacteraceae bacterium]